MPLAITLGVILMGISFVLSWGARQQLHLALHRLGTERAQAAADSGLVLALQALEANSSYPGQAEPVVLGEGPETYQVQVFRNPKTMLSGQTIPGDCIYIVSQGAFRSTTRRRATALVRVGSSGTKGLPGAFSSSMSISNGAWIDSYDSRQGAFKKGGSQARVVTNSSKAGSIQITGGARIAGSISVGVEGKVDATAPNGSTMGKNTTIWKDWGASYGAAEVQKTPLDLPTIEAPGKPGSKDVDLGWNAKTLEPGSYDAVKIRNGASITLGPGTYIFDKLDIAGGATIKLSGDGPVKIYIWDEMNVSNGSRVSSSDVSPSRFQVYLAPGAKYDQSGGTELSGVIYGPGAKTELSNSATVYGAVIGDSLKLSGAAVIHYDLALLEFPLTGSDSGGSSKDLTVLFRQRL